jgi:cell division protein FtsQ
VNKKRIIRKVLVLGAWFLVISGMTTLLVAANRKQAEHVCREVLIGIRGTGEKFYIEKEDVLKQVEKSANGSLIQKPVTAINLSKLEKALESSPWISNAELYFDSRDALHVFVEEREPIARIFTTAGASSYIDSSGHKMPLLEKVSARVPVITGFTNAKRFNGTDSALLNSVKQVAIFIYHSDFWNAQIGQVDITPEGTFELIPVVGDHIIRLGSAEKVEEKLGRLFVFYKQVMSKVGFNKYSALDVRYDGQVVAINKGAASAVDSIQLKKNIEDLMNKANLETVEQDMLPEQNSNPIAVRDSSVSTMATQNNSVSVKTNPTPTSMQQASSNAAKTKTQSKPVEKQKPPVKKIIVKRPKAVMKKKTN